MTHDIPPLRLQQPVSLAGNLPIERVENLQESLGDQPDETDTTSLTNAIAALQARVAALELLLAGYSDTVAQLCPAGSVTVLTK